MLRRRRDFMAIEDGQLALQNHGQGHQATDLAISGAAGMGETPKSDAGQMQRLLRSHHLFLGRRPHLGFLDQSRMVPQCNASQQGLNRWKRGRRQAVWTSCLGRCSQGQLGCCDTIHSAVVHSRGASDGGPSHRSTSNLWVDVAVLTRHVTRFSSK